MNLHRVLTSLQSVLSAHGSAATRFLKAPGDSYFLADCAHMPLRLRLQLSQHQCLQAHLCTSCPLRFGLLSVQPLSTYTPIFRTCIRVNGREASFDHLDGDIR